MGGRVPDMKLPALMGGQNRGGAGYSMGPPSQHGTVGGPSHRGQ